MKSKARLGKGLEALIPASSTDDLSKPQSAISELDVALIEANPFQPRIIFEEESFQDLKKSIKEKGVIQPILVRAIDGGRYQVVAGERRLRASLDLGIKQIPAYVKQIDTDEEMLEIALIENVQREHLNPIDLGLGYQRLIDECGLTQEEVAKKIGKDRTTVANAIRLMKLPPKIQESLRHGEIREGHARALLGVSDKKNQERIWLKTIKEALSVRSVEQLVRKSSDKHRAKADKAVNSRKSSYLAKSEDKLREKLGTMVKIRPKKEGGTIEIVFYSSEDMERLMDIFEGIKL